MPNEVLASRQRGVHPQKAAGQGGCSGAPVDGEAPDREAPAPAAPAPTRTFHAASAAASQHAPRAPSRLDVAQHLAPARLRRDVLVLDEQHLVPREDVQPGLRAGGEGGAAVGSIPNVVAVGCAREAPTASGIS